MDELKDHFPESYYGFIYHYYRAEVYRETNWRTRLDVTANWAIVVTAAILSFVFTNAEVTHNVIIVNFLVVWYFLYTESRRFRYYTMLKERTRILEHELFSPIFSGEKINPKNLEAIKERLVTSLQTPQIHMSRLESIAWRLRRNYVMLFPLIFLAWIAKVHSYPRIAMNISDFFANAKIWFISGEIVTVAFFLSIIVTIATAYYIPQNSLDDDLP